MMVLVAVLLAVGAQWQTIEKGAKTAFVALSATDDTAWALVCEDGRYGFGFMHRRHRIVFERDRQFVQYAFDRGAWQNGEIEPVPDTVLAVFNVLSSPSYREFIRASRLRLKYAVRAPEGPQLIEETFDISGLTARYPQELRKCVTEQ